VAPIIDRRAQPLGQADLPTNPTQDHGAKVRRQGAAVEVAPDAETGDRGKAQLFWGRLGHRRPRLASSGPFLEECQFYQLVERGSLFFMNNSG
jgi:hypothetical protein